MWVIHEAIGSGCQDHYHVPDHTVVGVGHMWPGSNDFRSFMNPLIREAIGCGSFMKPLGHMWPGSNDFRSFMNPLIREAIGCGSQLAAVHGMKPLDVSHLVHEAIGSGLSTTTTAGGSSRDEAIGCKSSARTSTEGTSSLMKSAG